MEAYPPAVGDHLRSDSAPVDAGSGHSRESSPIRIVLKRSYANRFYPQGVCSNVRQAGTSMLSMSHRLGEFMDMTVSNREFGTRGISMMLVFLNL